MAVWLDDEAPTTRRRSASFMSHDATGVPERPGTSAPRGWVSGTRPLAGNVVSTGAPNLSATAFRAPQPTMNTDRAADSMMVTAVSMLGADGEVLRSACLTAVAASSA
jgi:hypothetical protein